MNFLLIRGIMNHRKTKFIGAKNGNNRLAWFNSFCVLWVASSRGKLPHKKFRWANMGIFDDVVLGRGVYFCLCFAHYVVTFGFQLYR